MKGGERHLTCQNPGRWMYEQTVFNDKTTKKNEQKKNNQRQKKNQKLKQSNRLGQDKGREI